MSSTLFHRPGTHAKTLRVMSAVGGCAVVALLASGCGGATAGTAASSASAAPSQGASAYLTCLRQHGVNIPTTRPTARPTARPSGGFAANPAMQKARQACASLRPAGGFGGGQFAAAFQAFRSCMAAHGETIPATRPTAPPATPPSPGAGRFLGGLNPSDPKVAAALKACRAKLPRFPGATPRPSAG